MPCRDWLPKYRNDPPFYWFCHQCDTPYRSEQNFADHLRIMDHSEKCRFCNGIVQLPVDCKHCRLRHWKMEWYVDRYKYWFTYDIFLDFTIKKQRLGDRPGIAINGGIPHFCNR